MILRFFQLASANLSKILLAFILLKLCTFNLGPDQFGKLGHFISFISLLFVFAGGGISNGILSLVRESKSAEDINNEIRYSLLFYSMIFSLSILAFLLFFSSPIAEFIFDDSKLSYLIIISGMCGLFYAFINFYLSFINALFKTKEYAIINFCGFLIGGFVIYFLIKKYGFFGAVFAYHAQFLVLLVPIIFYRRLLPMPLINFSKININHISVALNYSFISIAGLISVPVIEFIIRELIINNIGLKEAGYWQALNRLSVANMSFFIVFLSYYLLPSLSSNVSKNKRIYTQILLLIIPIFFCIASFVILFKDYLIPILLSEEFLIINNFLWIQFLGDFFKLLSYSMLFLAIYRAKFKMILAFEIAQVILLLGFSKFFLFFDFDLLNIYYAYSIAYFIYFLLASFWFFYEIRK